MTGRPERRRWDDEVRRLEADRTALEGLLAASHAANTALAAEVGRLRGDCDHVARMLAKARHKGSWDRTPAEWVALGRVMAGLKPEVEGR